MTPGRRRLRQRTRSNPAVEPNQHAEIATARASLESGEPHLFRKPFGAPWGIEPFLKWATIGYALDELGVPPDAEILDLGCGEGWASVFLAEAGYRPTGHRNGFVESRP